MSLLLSELNRLYCVHQPDGQSGGDPATRLIDSEGRVRAMVLELARPTDWSTLATVWRGVQADLGLPAPAIAVSGIDGHQLWFSLEEPVAAADAQVFLEALCVRYLGAVERRRIRMASGPDARLVPALQAANGLWSAFISSDLAAIFTDEPWLDLEPNPDAQARLLSPLQSIKPGAFQAVVGRTSPAAPTTATAVQASHPDPKRFLLDVMNDPTVALHLRMDAAKALLPFCKDRS